MATLLKNKEKRRRIKMAKECKRVNAYNKQTQRVLILHISKIYDLDVLKWLEDNKPYQTAIKWLVREQIKREEEEGE